MRVGLVSRVLILLLESFNFQEKSGEPKNGIVICLLGFYSELGNGHCGKRSSFPGHVRTLFEQEKSLVNFYPGPVA